MVRLFGYHTSRFDAHLLLWEFVIFFLSFTIPVFGGSLSSDAVGIDFYQILVSAVLFAMLLSASMFAFGLDSRALEADDGAFPIRLALAVLIGGVVLGVAFFSLSPELVSLGLLPASLVCAFIGILLTRGAFSRVVKMGANGRRVIIIGSGERALEINNLLTRARSVRYDIAGYYDTTLTSMTPVSVPKSKLLDNNRSLVDLAIDGRVDEIIVAVNDRRGAIPIESLLEAKLNGIEVTDLVTFYERECSTIKFEHMRPSWIVFSSDFKLGVHKRFIKRAFDLVMSAILLVATAPVMLIVVLASLIESRGRDPILYYQERVGYGGRTFWLYKFRSMMVNAERDGVARWATANDSRVTGLGRLLRRYRLDELPQLFNVLAGDMSLVGPRPERPEFVKNLGAAIPFYIERHCVKPGLAGWAQLMYPYGSSIEDAKRKLEYDLYYVKHASVILDMVILLRTVEVVLLGKGVR